MIYRKKNRAIICDIDGVILNPTKRKNKYLKETGVYEDFLIGGEDDEVITLGVNFLKSQLREDTELFYLTGRSRHHDKSLTEFMRQGVIPTGQVMYMALAQEIQKGEDAKYKTYYEFKSKGVQLVHELYDLELVIDDSYEVLDFCKTFNNTIDSVIFYHFANGLGSHEEVYTDLCDKLDNQLKNDLEKQKHGTKTPIL